MNKKSFQHTLGFNNRVINMNMEGLSNAQTLECPERGGSSLNWVLGHIIYCRGLIGKLVDANLDHFEEATRYRRGERPTSNPAEVADLDTLMKHIKRSEKQLMIAFEKLSDDRLDEKFEEDDFPFEVNTCAEAIAYFQYHETYHCGQLGAIRRAIGCGGAIA